MREVIKEPEWNEIPKKIRIYQDFEFNDKPNFYFGFLIPTRIKIDNGKEAEEFLTNDVWVLTRNGLIKNDEFVKLVEKDHLNLPAFNLNPKLVKLLVDTIEKVKEKRINFPTSKFSKIGLLSVHYSLPIKQQEEIESSLKLKSIPFEQWISRIHSYYLETMPSLGDFGDLGDEGDFTLDILLFLKGTLEQDWYVLTQVTKGTFGTKVTLFLDQLLMLHEEIKQLIEKIRKVKEIDENIATDFVRTLNSFNRLLLELIESIINYYIIYKEEKASRFIAIWIMGTYLYRIFNYYPYVQFWGEKGSGKTKNLDIIECLAFNPLNASDLTSASLFRMTEAFQATLLIDEADPISKRESELRQLLLSGYQKGKYAWRISERKKKAKTLIPQKFDIFTPKALAGIKGFDDVLEDRCIKITMVKSSKEQAKREIHKDWKLWDYVRFFGYVFAITNFYRAKLIYNLLDTREITGRYRDLWKPILTLACLFGNDVFEEMYSYALEKIEQRKKEELEENPTYLILRLLAWKTKDKEQIEISSREISESLQKVFEINIDSRKIAAVLKKLYLTEESKRKQGIRYFVISKKQIDDLLLSYGLSREEIHKEFEEIIEQSGKKFERIDPHFGTCEYCGQHKLLEWKDAEGHLLCNECKLEEEIT